MDRQNSLLGNFCECVDERAFNIGAYLATVKSNKDISPIREAHSQLNKDLRTLQEITPRNRLGQLLVSAFGITGPTEYNCNSFQKEVKLDGFVFNDKNLKSIAVGSAQRLNQETKKLIERFEEKGALTKQERDILSVLNRMERNSSIIANFEKSLTPGKK